MELIKEPMVIKKKTVYGTLYARRQTYMAIYSNDPDKQQPSITLDLDVEAGVMKSICDTLSSDEAYASEVSFKYLEQNRSYGQDKRKVRTYVDDTIIRLLRWAYKKMEQQSKQSEFYTKFLGLPTPLLSLKDD